MSKADFLRWREAAEAIKGLPTEPYLGLTWEQAQERAAAEGRDIYRAQPGFPGRPQGMMTRVQVVLDEQAVVVDVVAG